MRQEIRLTPGKDGSGRTFSTTIPLEAVEQTRILIRRYPDGYGTLEILDPDGAEPRIIRAPLEGILDYLEHSSHIRRVSASSDVVRAA
jgi:hypothetical protein